MMMLEEEPIHFDQALNNSNWYEFMKEELRAIKKNKTWELLERASKKPIDVQWV